VNKVIGEPQLEGTDAARLAERASGKRLSSGAVSDYWLKKSWDYIRAEPTQWLRSGQEMADGLECPGSRRLGRFFISIANGPGLLAFLSWINHFGVLAPLAAAGAWLSRNEWRRLWLLYA